MYLTADIYSAAAKNWESFLRNLVDNKLFSIRNFYKSFTARSKASRVQKEFDSFLHQNIRKT